jgi:Kef-type K+ transport system membrane component KefB
MHEFLADIVIAIITATAAGILFHFLRQPVIVGYLLAGVLISPEISPHLINNVESIQTISEIGIVLLMFLVGLEMNISTIAKNGRAYLLPGIGQFALSCAAGVPFFVFMGFCSGIIGAFYLAAACALSSTAIVIKSLYDNYEIDTLHGRISVGILIIQDIWALLALVVLPGIGKGGATLALLSVGKTILLVAAALVVSRFLLSRIFTRLTKSPEMTVVMSIGWCALCSAVAGKAGLSPALGSLAGGMAIASFPYHVFVRDKVEPLRDLFLLLFFVSLGLKIPFPDLSLLSVTGAIFAFMIVSRFLTIYPLVRISGGSKRTSFLSSLNLTQVSEFSLVILATGIAGGALTDREISPILYLMALSAITSSYFVRYGHSIHTFMSRYFGFKMKSESIPFVADRDFPIMILGLHRGSQALIEMIVKRAPHLIPHICVVDYNAEILNQLRKTGIAGHLGDISRMETLEKAGISRARVVISTIPQMLLKGTDSARLIRMVRQLSPNASIIASADFKNQVPALEEAGADRVILPYFVAGEECADMVIGIMGRILPPQ